MKEETDSIRRHRARRWRPFGTPRTFAVLVGSMLVVGAIVYGVFLAYSSSLSAEFNKMSIEGMDDFTLAQKVEVESNMSEIRSTVSTMRTLAESPDVDPEGPTFSEFLDSWNAQGSYRVTYATISSLEEGADAAGLSDGERETYEKLKAGEGVVSDVRKSSRLGGYYYSIAEPVVRDGAVVGVLRSVVDAHSLLDTSQIKSQVTLLGSVLMKENGTIIIDSEASGLYDGQLLYDVLAQQGFSSETVGEMRKNVENDQDVATVIIGKREGRMLFFTSVRLGDNGWTIGNFTEENTIAEHSDVILHDTVVAGTVLVIISSIACIAVALVIGRFRRRALREAERYAVLAEFSDTVLFEYSYVDDVLELTPNARGVFPLEGLRSERYLERGVTFVDFHPDDLPAVKRLLADPAAPGEVRKAVARARVLGGDYRWFSITCRYLYEGSEPYAAVGKMVDVTQQHVLEQQLVRRSQIDGLTKALNKTTAEEKIAAALLRGDRGLLFVIDVDHFKQINDTCGHRKGDQVLRDIAAALFDVFRHDDPVGRVGGDEFVAFVVGAADDEVAATKRAALHERVSVVASKLDLPVSLSIGVARYPEDGASYQELFDFADQAMYRDKQRRR